MLTKSLAQGHTSAANQMRVLTGASLWRGAFPKHPALKLQRFVYGPDGLNGCLVHLASVVAPDIHITMATNPRNACSRAYLWRKSHAHGARRRCSEFATFVLFGRRIGIVA